MITEENRFDALDKVLLEIRSILEPLSEEDHPEIAERVGHFLGKGARILAPARKVGGEKLQPFTVIGTVGQAKDKPDQEINLSIYPLFPEDAHFGETATRAVSQVKAAAYEQGGHTIILNMASQETDRFIACCLIHELGHAYRAEIEKRALTTIARPRTERLAEEVEMWTADYKLMLDLGGENYRRVAQAFSHKIREAWAKKKATPQPTDMGQILMLCWGPMVSVHATANRDENFGMYCQMQAADQFLDAAEALQYKANILRPIMFYQYDLENQITPSPA